ncbi:class I SAM-dependent methyltransferase [Selenihalanaerobacter shriftii]|uniref:Methyltransferase domain-containing protein n=1 Tax=Selenihalanaerobacter shriftii TaxID=142842 RepID=A0A1T4LSV9_9FIRM|nr:class I SAM-dependent methyltransferase [Selenihalanaerobacter shriftii]SJZ57544.1 Methyltransferase domain-containing protein [Selenihalanaerobacter shriftii]
MEFYTEISKYYDYIFPLSEEKFNFFKNNLSKNGEDKSSILDIGTSTGSYAVRLAESGYKVTAIDLDEIMVQRCQQKASEAEIEVTTFKLDMMKLTDKLKQKFDGIICIGNTLVHLSNLDEITEVISQIHELLNSSGKLMMQIVNYDRILKYKINELPRIDREEIGLTFIRKYNFRKDNKIDFNTTLKVNDDQFKNSIQLYPLTSTELITVIEEVGFNNYKLYGDFNFNDYNQDESGPLVLVAEK